VNHLLTRPAVAILFAISWPALTAGQDRLKGMPGDDQYQKLSREIPTSYKSGAVVGTWKDGGKAFEYRWDGKIHLYDIAAGKDVVKGDAGEGGQPFRGGGRGGFGGQRGGGGAGGGGGQRGGGDGGPPAGGGQGGPPGVTGLDGPPQFPGGGGMFMRGRQAATAASPDGQYKAFYKARNLWLADAKGVIEMPITTDGNEKDRIKNGAASWVYGEELSQRTAMWWSPDGKRVAFYRFDESKVPDYFLATDQTALMSRANSEPYPKPGAPNPVVDVLVYDLPSKKTTRIDVRDGKPFENTAVGHYVYNVRWSPDGKEVLFHRTNRKQDVMEFAAADPTTGKCRVIVREEWPASWTENNPAIRYLKDNKRFVWASERTGFRNFYLYDLSGKLIAPLTKHEFEVANVVRIDEDAGHLFYMARSGDNPMKLQLHRVGLDGEGDTRLTDPAFHHTVDLAPDGKHFIDTIQTHDTPPASRLVNADGEVLAELATSDLTRFDKLGLKRVELLTYKAADGETDLYGLLHFPSNFDPAKKYPLLVSVYAGPGTNGARETFATPNPLTEYGFLVATLDSRSAGGRGKKFLDAIYRKLGVTEIDDQAAGVKSLWDRPYLDKKRVGIFGGSYGGFASVLCLLRHPDVFQAACASSPVTDYRLYDSIYTERYMGLPQDNKAGYDAGSALTHVTKLRGRLMLYFGTADTNVHPSNSMQLIRALQRAGKSFDLQIGPDQNHSRISQPRMMEFFIENLVLAKPPAAAK
jgi:dipeptidyl-peptidase-4